MLVARRSLSLGKQSCLSRARQLQDRVDVRQPQMLRSYKRRPVHREAEHLRCAPEAGRAELHAGPARERAEGRRPCVSVGRVNVGHHCPAHLHGMLDRPELTGRQQRFNASHTCTVRQAQGEGKPRILSVEMLTTPSG